MSDTVNVVAAHHVGFTGDKHLLAVGVISAAIFDEKVMLLQVSKFVDLLP